MPARALEDPPGDALLRRLLESSSDLIALLDAEGVVRYASPSHQTVLGYRPDDLIGRNAFTLVHPDDCAALLATFRVGIANGEHTDTGEFRYRCADGAWKVLHGIGRNLLDEPTVAGIVVTSRDVTARHRDEEVLRQREHRLAAQLAELELLYATAPIGLALVDRELRFVRVNERLAAINGRPAAAHCGVLVRDVIPTLAPVVVPLYERVLATGTAVLDFEVCGRSPADPSDERVWLVNCHPVRDGAGGMAGVSVVVQDITARKRAERALEDAHRTLEERVRERTAELAAAVERLRAEGAERVRIHAALELSEGKHRALIETIRDAVFTIDEAGTITYMSPAIEALTGYTPAEVLGHRFSEYVHPDDLASAAGSFARSLAGIVEPLECRAMTRAGEVRWIRTLSRYVEGPDGRAELRGVLTDVTARRQAEELARRHQADLAHVQRVATVGEMTAQVAHEINQPLAAIVNFADGLVLRLRSGAVDQDTVRNVSAQIAAEGRRAAEVIRRLREFVRKGDLQSEPTDLNDLVREVLALLEVDARRHAIALRVDLDETLGLLSLDRIQIQQVVVNLVRNAIEAIAATDAGERSVVVATRLDDGNAVRLAVRDTGVGLPSGANGDIFEAFYTTKPDGLGIGLAISRSIVEAHGGRLWAEPADGRGATFLVSLPRG